MAKTTQFEAGDIVFKMELSPSKYSLVTNFNVAHINFFSYKLITTSMREHLPTNEPEGNK